MEKLPIPVLTFIFSHLNPYELAMAGRVCTSWRRATTKAWCNLAEFYKEMDPPDAGARRRLCLHHFVSLDLFTRQPATYTISLEALPVHMNIAQHNEMPVLACSFPSKSPEFFSLSCNGGVRKITSNYDALPWPTWFQHSDRVALSGGTAIAETGHCLRWEGCESPESLIFQCRPTKSLLPLRLWPYGDAVAVVRTTGIRIIYTHQKKVKLRLLRTFFGEIETALIAKDDKGHLLLITRRKLTIQIWRYPLGPF